jgi:hypothetical protein
MRVARQQLMSRQLNDVRLMVAMIDGIDFSERTNVISARDQIFRGRGSPLKAVALPAFRD